jgi:uncharacterized protein YjbJ (UPF0337 family)
MDEQRVKGAVDEVVGSAKRHIGGWTGNVQTQAEGVAQQIKGKVETTFGKVKDAVRDVKDNADQQQDAECVNRKVIAAEDRNIL